MKKITCLIIDDEPLAGQLLETHLRQVPFMELLGTCFHALEALAFLEKQPVDVLFLDINLPQLSGMQLKALLPPTQKVIFTTAYSEFAVESYEKNALDYLLKPITFERFMKAVLKLKTLYNEPVDNASESLFVKSGRELIRVEFDELLFVEGLKDYVTMVTENQRIIAHKRLRDLEEILPSQFHRVHLSYIANLTKINKISDNHLYIGDYHLPIGEKYRDSFLQKIELLTL